ncbi:hypothetical protein J3R30DRAFT_3459082 [Lentinula aciculospora]|uniref:Uncharacterized protein n=1 Tax=Lentinula aciculospora TaxID=153920 RepID=A0A9W9AGT2_9AGAR|nr:hypothetical protein J3R30DRAFT_3459082 [Lentinula aciculospora]
MRFNFSSFLVLGIVSAVYALPSSELDRRHSSSTETVFLGHAVHSPRSPSIHVDFDARKNPSPRAIDPDSTTTISVTFPVTGPRKSTKVQNAAKVAVKSLLNAAKSKLGISGNIQVTFTNRFTSPKTMPTEVPFVFSVEACQGRCKGTAKGLGKGIISDAKNRVIFQAD